MTVTLHPEPSNGTVAGTPKWVHDAIFGSQDIFFHMFLLGASSTVTSDPFSGFCIFPQIVYFIEHILYSISLSDIKMVHLKGYAMCVCVRMCACKRKFNIIYISIWNQSSYFYNEKWSLTNSFVVNFSCPLLPCRPISNSYWHCLLSLFYFGLFLAIWPAAS